MATVGTWDLAVYLLAGGEVCECLPMPRNYFHHPELGWDDGRPLTGSPVADGAEYLAGGFDRFAIVCPECHLVYAAGAE